MQQLIKGTKREREQIEIQLLLEGIFQFYGFDFRNYARASITRRIKHRMQTEQLSTITELLNQVLHNKEVVRRLLQDFSINVTEMFRDPDFFLAFRKKVVPKLRELSSIRIWHAGCSTGEEVFSMAILLYEEGLYSKSMIYATDMNDTVIKQAETSIFPLEKMQLYTKNYLQSGGKQAFSEYYQVQDHEVKFKSFLSKNIVFSQHNLVTDHSFNDFHIIMCRNVLIYFNSLLQKRVFQLFNDSLTSSGYLGLGDKERIPKHFEQHYSEIDREHRIYMKKG